ncbi:DMT family transporter [Rhodovibrionaceae bacterium A322]
MSPNLSLRPLDLLLLVTVMMIWGFNFVVVKVTLEELPVFLTIALRFALVAAVLIPFVPRPSGHWKQILLLSFSLGFLHFILMFTGIAGIDVSTAAIAIQLQVPFASLLAAIFFGEKLGWRRALGMTLAFGGVAIMAGEPRLEGSLVSLGLVISGALIWAVSNIQVKKLESLSAWTVSAWMSLFAVPQLLLGSWLLEDGQIAAVQQASMQAWVGVIYNSLAVMLLGYGLYYMLLKRHPVNVVMPFTLLVPFFGVLSGVVFMGDQLTPALLVGGATTIVGVGIILIRRAGKVATEPLPTAPNAAATTQSAERSP